MGWRIPVEEVLKVEQETLQDIEKGPDGYHCMEHYITVRVVGGYDLEDVTVDGHQNTVTICIKAVGRGGESA